MYIQYSKIDFWCSTSQLTLMSVLSYNAGCNDHFWTVALFLPLPHTAHLKSIHKGLKYFLKLQSYSYSLISTRQLHIFSIKPKLDMQLFVDFYVFTRFWLNLSDRNLKLFWTSKQNNFRFRSSKFSQKWVKTQKSTNNRMSSFGLIENIWSCLIFI